MILRPLFLDKDLELIVSSERNPDFSTYENPCKEAISHIQHRYKDVKNKVSDYQFKPCNKCFHYRHNHKLGYSKGTFWQQLKCLIVYGHGMCNECNCKHYEKPTLTNWLKVADQHMKSYGFQSRDSQRRGFDWAL